MEQKAIIGMAVGVALAVGILIGLWYGVTKVTTPVPVAETYETVSLFVYDKSRDQVYNGKPLCLSQAMTDITREQPSNKASLPDIIELLMEGVLDPKERAEGLKTEFPVDQVELVNVLVHEGTATVTFHDPLRTLSEDTCRTRTLRHQLEYTILAYPGISDVEFLPEGILRP